MPPVAELDALPAGTRLAEFEIERVLGVGGFGIVYLAFDHALERQVAIKEYMPAALASRGQGVDIRLRSASHAETFALGLRSFINESRLLARFDHPALVKVYRFWEEHGTAYMVMPYYKGQTVQNVRREMEAPPDEAWLRQLIEPLLGALDCLHREQVFHRDIAPDNILLLDSEDGQGPRPVLLDLGAARHVIGDRTQSLTAILKPSFAPIEQYAETVQLRQGAWTDLYALAAVVYFCVTGRPPTPATARAVHDDLPSLSQMSAGLASGFDRIYSASFVNAIDHALAVHPNARPDSVAAWRDELSGMVSVEAVASRGASAEGSTVGPAGSGQGKGWVSNTVLVRPANGEKPAGHAAIEAGAFLTTIPAASALRKPPRWPITVVDEGAAGQPEVPELVAADELPSPYQRWVLVALISATLAMGWWMQQHWSRSAEVSAVAAKPDKTSLGKTAGRDKAKPAASEPVQAKQVDMTEPEGRERVSARKRSTPAAVSAEPLNPRQACGSRVFISMAICMKRHCSRPEYSAHPECRRMREQEETQRNYP
ncbi:MAG: protein kinase [Pseudomonadota bacterium]